MDQLDDLRFIDEDSPRSDTVDYVWKKKKAVQKEKDKSDLRLNLHESNSDWSKSDFNTTNYKTDSIDTSFMEECDLSCCESSLSPRAPVANCAENKENRNEIQLDVLFTDDVTVSVSFKGGKIVIEEKSEMDENTDREIDEIIQESNCLGGLVKCDFETTCSVGNSILGDVNHVKVVKEEHEVKVRNKCKCGNKMESDELATDSIEEGKCYKIENYVEKGNFDSLKRDKVVQERCFGSVEEGDDHFSSNVKREIDSQTEEMETEDRQDKEDCASNVEKENDCQEKETIEEETDYFCSSRIFVSNLDEDTLVSDKITDTDLKNKMGVFLNRNLFDTNPFIDMQLNSECLNIDTISIDGQIIELDKSKIAELAKSLSETKPDSLKEDSCEFWFPRGTNLDVVVDRGLDSGISGVVLYNLGDNREEETGKREQYSSLWLTDVKNQSGLDVLNVKQSVEINLNKDFKVGESFDETEGVLFVKQNSEYPSEFNKDFTLSENVGETGISKNLSFRCVEEKQTHEIIEKRNSPELNTNSEVCEQIRESNNFNQNTKLQSKEISEETEKQDIEMVSPEVNVHFNVGEDIIKNSVNESTEMNSKENTDERNIVDKKENQFNKHIIPTILIDGKSTENEVEVKEEIITKKIESNNENKSNFLTVPEQKYGKEITEPIIEIVQKRWSDVIEEENEGLETIFEEKEDEDSDDEYYDSENQENFEKSLHVLSAFRDNLIPGITSATDWINHSDSDEIGIEGSEEDTVCEDSVVGEITCRRAFVSTGAVGLMLPSAESNSPASTQTDSYGQGSEGVDISIENSSIVSDSTDSYSTVQSVASVERRYVDQEIQVDTICAKCENSVEKSDVNIEKPKEVNFKGLKLDLTFEKPKDLKCLVDLPLIFPCARRLSVNKDSVFSEKKSDNGENLKKTVIDTCELIDGSENKIVDKSSDFIDENKNKRSELIDENVNTILTNKSKELSDENINNILHDKSNELIKENVNKIFTVSSNELSVENVNKVIVDKSSDLIDENSNKKSELKDENTNKLLCDKDIEFTDEKFENINQTFFGKSSELSNDNTNKIVDVKNGEPIDENINKTLLDKHDSFQIEGGVDKLKYNFDGVRNLFQFNVHRNEELVTSFCEDFRSSEDEMKQKKKAEEMESSSSNSDLCNGYHRQGVLKSALKRSSTKKSKKKNRVQFDESLNKFFDADYVILIREEPDEFEGDYDVSGCDCGDDFCYEGCCDEDEEFDDEEREFSDQKFDLCAAFEPPMEFVDQVTLSPPDGYKDISHSCCPHHYHQRNLAIQEHRRRNDDKGEWAVPEEVKEVQPVLEKKSEASNTEEGDLNEDPSTRSEASQCSEQSIAEQHEQQAQQRYIVETITMTTVTERRIVREADDQLVKKPPDQDDGKLSGILKGGKLWKSTDSGNQTDLEETPKKIEEISTNFDDDGKRSVRFFENETETKDTGTETETLQEPELLPFKVANHVIISNSKPNSAVRQLFPGPKFITPPPVPNRSPDSDDQEEKKYLVTSESLKMFEEAKKSKLQQYYSCRNKESCSQTLNSPQDHASDEDDGLQNNLIKRTIERNTLRRSLLKYPHDIRLKRNQNKMKNENSLVERIRQLTCDVDEEGDDKPKDETLPARTSPPGEESQKIQGSNKTDKVSSSGMSSTYKKLTDLFTRRDKLEAAHPSVLQTPISIGHQYPYYQPVYHQTSPPDLGNGLNSHLIGQKTIVRHSVTAEARKQFLSSLAPLTACVSGHLDESPVNKEVLNQPGERNSIASTSTAAETEYSLDDIEEVLNTQTEEKLQPQPDVVAGTPGGNSEQDELALFVQQDAGRIERIRKRYSSTPSSAGSDDDEHDDYGFNRRPSVRGIKPRFGSTTEILQQMQSQVQPPGLTCPSRVTWPYYTPTTEVRTKTSRGVMPIVKEEPPFTYVPDPNLDYSNTVDGRGYQIYSSTGNLHQPMRIGGGGDLPYHPRPVHYSESPPRVPPVGMMLPFQEEYQYRTTAPIYARRAVPGSVVQMRVSPGHPIRFNPPYVEPEPHYSTQPLPPGTTSIIRVGQQQTIRVPYSTGGPVQVHLLATRRSESPQRGSPSFQQNQFVVARGTQTTYYHVPNNPRGTYYPPPPPPPQNGPNYNRGPLIFSDKSYNNNYPNNPHRATSPIPSLTSSPTRIKPPERGVPEGAASSSPSFPQDSMYLHVSSSTNTSPPGDNQPMATDIISPNANPSTQPTGSSVFYAMNV